MTLNILLHRYIGTVYIGSRLPKPKASRPRSALTFRSDVIWNEPKSVREVKHEHVLSLSYRKTAITVKIDSFLRRAYVYHESLVLTASHHERRKLRRDWKINRQLPILLMYRNLRFHLRAIETFNTAIKICVRFTGRKMVRPVQLVPDFTIIKTTLGTTKAFFPQRKITE